MYSIDESFVDLSGIRGDLTERSRRVRQRILHWIGIPCGIGIGPTKTLAKLANHIAKTTERKAYDLLADAFGPGFNAPLTIVVKAGNPHGIRGLPDLAREPVDEANLDLSRTSPRRRHRPSLLALTFPFVRSNSALWRSSQNSNSSVLRPHSSLGGQ